MTSISVKELSDLLIYLGGVSAALTAMGILIRIVVVRPLKTWIKEQIQPPLHRIQAEITPNGGSSIKDDITGTRAEVKNLQIMFDRHLAEDVPATRRELDQLRATIDQHIASHLGGIA